MSLKLPEHKEIEQRLEALKKRLQTQIGFRAEAKALEFIRSFQKRAAFSELLIAEEQAELADQTPHQWIEGKDEPYLECEVCGGYVISHTMSVRAREKLARDKSCRRNQMNPRTSCYDYCVFRVMDC